MKIWLRRIVLLLLASGVLVAVWVWWNRPQPVDMAAYVPAGTLIYLEANSLPEVVQGLTATNAWRNLAPAAGLTQNVNRLGWLSHLSAWTGIGSAETVIFSRSQVAVAVLGFEATEESGTSLHIKPRIALVAETHTSAVRVQTALTKLIGNYARRAYGEPRIENKTPDDAIYITWATPDGTRKIIVAIEESVAIIGNDEETVRACLAVRRGEQPSLANDEQLAQMRLRMSAGEALAFGYVPSAGMGKLLEVAAVVYARQAASDPKIQSAAAILLPQLTTRLLGGMAWSSRLADGMVEDSYYLALANGLAARLHDSLTASDTAQIRAVDFLPGATYQLTSYRFRDPEAAWRGLIAAISSQLEITIAPLIGRFLDESLVPFSIDAPRDFLRAAGPDITTARLDSDGSSLVLIATVRDRAALNALVRKRLGSSLKTETVGGAALLISAEAEQGAASFVDDVLIMGGAEEVRQCLADRAAARTLVTSQPVQAAVGGSFNPQPPDIITLTGERESTRRFISFLSRQSGLRKSPPDVVALQRSLSSLPYSRSETRLVEEGFEKQTRSAFGQFGSIVVQLATDAETGQAR